MKVHLQEGSSRIFEGGASRVSEVLLALDLNPAAVIVSRDGKVIPDDAALRADDEIRVIRVSHGG
jgi:sulfur carrier protein ThiS